MLFKSLNYQNIIDQRNTLIDNSVNEIIKELTKTLYADPYKIISINKMLNLTDDEQNEIYTTLKNLSFIHMDGYDPIVNPIKDMSEFLSLSIDDMLLFDSPSFIETYGDQHSKDYPNILSIEEIADLIDKNNPELTTDQALTLLSDHVTSYNTEKKYVESKFNIKHSKERLPELVGLIKTLKKQDNVDIILNLSSPEIIINLY